MSYYGWAPYVSVAERRKKAEKAAAKARKSGANLSPIEPYRGAIAKTFWGKAWCDNLEAYSDYANRMPRGRTYVRNGSVIHLEISEGQVQAKVMGSSLYQVSVKVTEVPQSQWHAIGKDCSGSIDSLVELLQGKLSTAVMQRICTPRTGLFPAPKEISFSCSCPDSASMCKHIAAVLYGVGARLDQKPELLFGLRKVNAKDLVNQAGSGLQKSMRGPAVGMVLDDAMLADVFGIEMDDVPTKKSSSRKKAGPAKKMAPKALEMTTASVVGIRKKPADNLRSASVKAIAVAEKQTKVKDAAPKRKAPAAKKLVAARPVIKQAGSRVPSAKGKEKSAKAAQTHVTQARKIPAKIRRPS
jgi:uncharacterized Zn finger protein